MNEANLFKVTIGPVKGLSTFQRKTTGKTGQQIKCDNPANDYTFRYECVDMDIFDFSVMKKGKSYICSAEPYLRVENIRRFDGNNMYISIPSYRLVAVLEEVK